MKTLELNSVSAILMIEEQEIELWKIQVNDLNFYIVKDEISDFITELENGESNQDVGLFQTLNHALEVWKNLVIDRIKEIHF